MVWVFNLIFFCSIYHSFLLYFSNKVYDIFTDTYSDRRLERCQSRRQKQIWSWFENSSKDFMSSKWFWGLSVPEKAVQNSQVIQLRESCVWKFWNLDQSRIWWILISFFSQSAYCKNKLLSSSLYIFKESWEKNMSWILCIGDIISILLGT